jgi:hypothetical protein
VLDQELKLGAESLRVSCLSVGNPHCVLLSDDVTRHDSTGSVRGSRSRQPSPIASTSSSAAFEAGPTSRSRVGARCRTHAGLRNGRMRGSRRRAVAGKDRLHGHGRLAGWPPRGHVARRGLAHLPRRVPRAASSPAASRSTEAGPFPFAASASPQTLFSVACSGRIAHSVRAARSCLDSGQPKECLRTARQHLDTDDHGSARSEAGPHSATPAFARVTGRERCATSTPREESVARSYCSRS